MLQCYDNLVSFLLFNKAYQALPTCITTQKSNNLKSIELVSIQEKISKKEIIDKINHVLKEYKFQSKSTSFIITETM